jgi:hypothetical protein
MPMVEPGREVDEGPSAERRALLVRTGDLELEEDVDFQRREWRVERVGWALVLAVVAAALLGVFGHGPVSWTTSTSDDGRLAVSYERFGRRGGSQTIVVVAAASAARDGSWVLEFDRRYVASIGVTDIVPEPESSELAGDAIRYSFVQVDPGADLEVRFDLAPQALWREQGSVALDGAGAIDIDQFFFP